MTCKILNWGIEMKVVEGDKYEDKGSKFFGFYVNVNSLIDFKEFLAKIKVEHPNADHHC